MAITIQQFTPSTALQGLADALTEARLFDSVTVSGGTLTAVKDGNTLFTFSSPASPTYAWYNKYGTTIYSGYAAEAPLYVVAKCGSSVMMNFASAYTYDFIFGKTREGSVYFGFTYDHKNVLTSGQLISFCENTTTMYDGAFQSNVNQLWSRLMPICVQSNDYTVETVDGIFGFVERYAGIPLTSVADVSPKRYTMYGKEYVTDGSFMLADSNETGGES